MLDVLGLDPADPAWGPASSNDAAADRRRRRARRRPARAAHPGAREQGLRRRRRDPRPDQGRRHRDRRTPPTARRGHWKQERSNGWDFETGAERLPQSPRKDTDWLAIRSARARSRRPARAIRRPAPVVASSAVSRVSGPTPQGQGPRVPQGLQEGEQGRQVRRRPAEASAAPATPTPSGSPVATPSSRRCARACRSTACTSPRVPSATVACARPSPWPPTAASACSR